MKKTIPKGLKSRARYFNEGGNWDVGEYNDDVTKNAKNDEDDLPSDKFEWEKKF